MNAVDQAKAAVLVVAIAIIGVLSYGLLRFEAAGGLKCDAPLRGSDPREKATGGFLVNREEGACDAEGGSRLTVGGIVGFLYLVVGIGAVFMPESPVEKMIFGGQDPEDVFPSPP
ncbi:MAG: hypothetical protein ACRD0S_11005 [Acidimicrobiales bacterium]